jgi:type IV pilus assembly protein PilZ
LERRTTDRRQTARRKEPRELVTLRVDYRSDENFLFAYATNVSSLGIFVLTHDPKEPGTPIELEFPAIDEDGPLRIRGEVVWVNPYRPGGENPNPGMGIRFSSVDPSQRERLVRTVRRIAYLHTIPGQA